MKKKGSGFKWIIMYIFTGLIDLAQIIVDFTGVGIAISEFIEFAMPFILIFVFQFIFKVSLFTKPSRLVSIIGATGLGAITGGIAPFWIVDVWYIQRSVKNEDAMYAEQESQAELLENKVRAPLYSNGVRSPQNPRIETESRSRNIDGIRPPNGGLK